MKRYLNAQKKYMESVSSTIQGLKQEKEETSAMMKTFFNVLTQKLPNGKKPEPNEIQAALEQLKDVHKMAGLLVLAIAPGAVVTLPAICALGKKYGVEVLPSSFQKMDKDELETIEELEMLLAEKTDDFFNNHEKSPKTAEKNTETP
ncbi:hypothetical protein NBRC116188_26780 [Oceaniserpentilla sp. 4NH20-0058]|uniref:hypothetical protein n=1 Tax=Oceaniserpentilla sp. 4NH20-0058 TaxID=3127660 RepID=UPI00310B6399